VRDRGIAIAEGTLAVFIHLDSEPVGHSEAHHPIHRLILKKWTARSIHRRSLPVESFSIRILSDIFIAAAAVLQRIISPVSFEKSLIS
jgi:hypothetical protein